MLYYSLDYDDDRDCFCLWLNDSYSGPLSLITSCSSDDRTSYNRILDEYDPVEYVVFE